MGLFSVLGHNVKKATSKDSDLPDESAIQAVFVIYCGESDNCSQEEVIESIIKVYKKGTDNQQLKALYLAFQILIRCESNQQTKKELKYIGNQFLKYQTVLYTLPQEGANISTFCAAVIAAMKCQTVSKLPIQKQCPEIVNLIKRTSSLSQTESNPLLHYMSVQFVAHVIKIMSTVLTDLVQEFQSGANMKWASAYASEFRIHLQPLMIFCQNVGIQAEIQDIPDMIEQMATGKFTGLKTIISEPRPVEEFQNFAPIQQNQQQIPSNQQFTYQNNLPVCQVPSQQFQPPMTQQGQPSMAQQGQPPMMLQQPPLMKQPPLMSQPPMMQQQQQPLMSQPPMMQQQQQPLMSQPPMMQQQQQPLMSQPPMMQQQQQPLMSQPPMMQQQQQPLMSQPPMMQQQPPQMYQQQPPIIQQGQHPMMQQMNYQRNQQQVTPPNFQYQPQNNGGRVLQ